MGDMDRFGVFVEKHIGVGIRWESYFYTIDLSIAFPFVTFLIGVGRKKDSEASHE